MIGAANPGLTWGYTEEGHSRVSVRGYPSRGVPQSGGNHDTLVLAALCVQANGPAASRQAGPICYSDTQATELGASSPFVCVCELAAEERETESFCETLCLEECVEQSSCEECRGQSSSPFATAGKQKVGGS